MANSELPKLFIFAIGGTGARVVKSLAFLLASGVKINASEVVPILVDPDHGNGDLNRTLDILRHYMRIRAAVNPKGGEFFGASIKTLAELSSNGGEGAARVSEQLQFSLQGTTDSFFRDFIGYSQMDPEDKAMMSMLFTEANLNASMEVGFKGNPNIGSVVLNQFNGSEQFQKFASQFGENDRIMIISSIFGGTGAAGFPLLYKNLREAEHPLPNHASIKKAKIGAISVQPYFGVEQKAESQIDKSTFISKTKAALVYYDRTITGNSATKKIDAIYYLADDGSLKSDYPNVEGAEEQRNKAHIVEYLAATAVIDFMAMNEDAFGASENAKEYGAVKKADPMDYTHLANTTVTGTLLPMACFQLMDIYFRLHLKEALDGKQAWTKGDVALNHEFFSGGFFTGHLLKFLTHYRDWLKELSENRRSFRPFELAISEKNVFTFVNGFSEKKGYNPFAKNNFTLFDEELNIASKDLQSRNKEAQLLDLFQCATTKLCKSKVENVTI